MKIIMRRVSVIFYSENHGNVNAIRRCLLDKINDFIKKEYYKKAFPFREDNRSKTTPLGLSTLGTS